jgi:hypothetical protein
MITGNRDGNGLTSRYSGRRCVMSQPSNYATKSDSLGAWMQDDAIEVRLKLLCRMMHSYKLRISRNTRSSVSYSNSIEWKKIYRILIIRIQHQVAIESQASRLLSSVQIKLVYLINANYQQHNRLPTSHNYYYIFKKLQLLDIVKNISSKPE